MSSGSWRRARTRSWWARRSCGRGTLPPRCGNSRCGTPEVIRIKICGITSAEDARLCWEAGADALGFIFVEGTPRHVTPAQAAAIIAGLPPFVTPVGVFWDHAPGHVKAVAEECGLGALQFHGDEAPADLDGYRLPALKASKVDGPEGLRRMAGYRGAGFLLESPARLRG